MHQLPDADRQRVPECAPPAAAQPDEPDGLDGGDERVDRRTSSHTASASCLSGLQSEADFAPTPGILSFLSLQFLNIWYVKYAGGGLQHEPCFTKRGPSEGEHPGSQWQRVHVRPLRPLHENHQSRL